MAAPATGDAVEYDLRHADVWAAGVTLFCFLFGRLPFDATNGPEALIASIQRDAPAFPDSAAAIGDGALRELLEGLLAKDPPERAGLSFAAQHLWLAQVPAVPPVGS